MRYILFPYVFKKCWCLLPEDGEIKATKRVGAMKFLLNFLFVTPLFQVWL